MREVKETIKIAKPASPRKLKNTFHCQICEEGGMGLGAFKAASKKPIVATVDRFEKCDQGWMMGGL